MFYPGPLYPALKVTYSSGLAAGSPVFVTLVEYCETVFAGERSHSKALQLRALQLPIITRLFKDFDSGVCQLHGEIHPAQPSRVMEQRSFPCSHLQGYNMHSSYCRRRIKCTSIHSSSYKQSAAHRGGGGGGGQPVSRSPGPSPQWHDG